MTQQEKERFAEKFAQGITSDIDRVINRLLAIAILSLLLAFFM